MGEPMKEVMWAVKTNTDLTEGRGREYVKHFCRMQATALRLAKRGYVQGSDCPVEPIELLNIDGKYLLPLSLLKIEAATPEDEAHEKRIVARKAAIERAKEAGLSDDDISLIGRAP